MTNYCNVPVAEPPGEPAIPRGFQRIPPGATPDQIANIVNNNFQLLAGSTTPKTTGGFKTKDTPAGKKNPDKTKEPNFVEDRPKRVTKTVRVFDPNDDTQYIDVEQIVGVHFTNPATSQTIAWKRD